MAKRAIDSGMSDAFGKKGDSKIQALEILNNKELIFYNLKI